MKSKNLVEHKRPLKIRGLHHAILVVSNIENEIVGV